MRWLIRWEKQNQKVFRKATKNVICLIICVMRLVSFRFSIVSLCFTHKQLGSKWLHLIPMLGSLCQQKPLPVVSYTSVVRHCEWHEHKSMTHWEFRTAPRCSSICVNLEIMSINLNQNRNKNPKQKLVSSSQKKNKLQLVYYDDTSDLHHPPGILRWYTARDNHWLVVSTHLKNISQIGHLPQVGVKIKKSLKPPPRSIYHFFAGMTIQHHHNASTLSMALTIFARSAAGRSLQHAIWRWANPRVKQPKVERAGFFKVSAAKSYGVRCLVVIACRLKNGTVTGSDWTIDIFEQKLVYWLCIVLACLGFSGLHWDKHFIVAFIRNL